MDSRPAMRRKSSAQNLLSSFKTPINVPSTPVMSTPLPNKEFDTMSLYSETTTVNNQPGTAGAQGTSVEYLRDLVQKRIITLTYIRNIHEGRSHWFHTIMISRAELDKEFNNTDMKKRTSRFTVLGMALSSLLDIQQPQDLLKQLISTLQEYEQAKEDGDKVKIQATTKRLFRNRLGKRPGVIGDLAYGDVSGLYAPHVPFALDYHQTLLSLLDVLSEVYNKISKILGPSPFPHNAQNMMGPLGLLAPHPGVSYLFSPPESTPGSGPYATPHQTHFSSNTHLSSSSHLPMGNEAEMGIGSLWSIANVNTSSHLFSVPMAVTWSPALGEMVLKIDGKFKKITTVLLKELDQFARNGIRAELSSLDPLLRNINIQEEGGKTIYDIEGM
ncbi:unnamed protein product [Mycena citricolor]|nr:unnamed protein product [Mycena citricolor]